MTREEKLSKIYEVIGEMNIVKALKTTFGGENVLVLCNHEEYRSLFSGYKRHKDNVYIVPYEDYIQIEQENPGEGRDYCLFTTRKGYGHYQYSRCRYHKKFRRGGGSVAYSLYKKRQSYDYMYNKVIDLFKEKYFNDQSYTLKKALKEVIDDQSDETISFIYDLIINNK